MSTSSRAKLDFDMHTKDELGKRQKDNIGIYHCESEPPHVNFTTCMGAFKTFWNLVA